MEALYSVLRHLNISLVGDKWGRVHDRVIWTIKQYFVLRKPPTSANTHLSQVVSDSVTPWTAAHQASLSLNVYLSFPKFMFIALVMPSKHLILCCPLLLLPSIFPSMRVFSNDKCKCMFIAAFI